MSRDKADAPGCTATGATRVASSPRRSPSCSAASPRTPSAAASRACCPRARSAARCSPSSRCTPAPTTRTPRSRRPALDLGRAGPLTVRTPRKSWPPPLTQTTGRRKEAVARARLVPAPAAHDQRSQFEAYFTTPPSAWPCPSRCASPTRGVRRRRVDPRRRRERSGGSAGNGDRPLARRARSRGASRVKKAGLLTRDPVGRRARSTASRRPARRRSPRSADPGPAALVMRSGAMRFGTDGVRGVANTELTPPFALSLGRGRPCAAPVHRRRRRRHAVVHTDARGRRSAGIAAEGVEVHRLGVLPTAAIAHVAAQMGAMGVVVSASHNPYHDNGIKLFAPAAPSWPTTWRTRSRLSYERWARRPVSPVGHRRHEGPRDDRGRYAEHVAASLDGRSLAGLRVVVDAANGAVPSKSAPARCSPVVGARASLCPSTFRCMVRSPCALCPSTAAGRTGGCGGRCRVPSSESAVDGDGYSVDRRRRDLVRAASDGDHVIAIRAVHMCSAGAVRAESTCTCRDGDGHPLAPGPGDGRSWHPGRRPPAASATGTARKKLQRALIRRAGASRAGTLTLHDRGH